MLQALMPQDVLFERNDLAAVGAAIHMLQASCFVGLTYQDRRFALIAAERTGELDELTRHRAKSQGRLVLSSYFRQEDDWSKWVGDELMADLPQDSDDSSALAAGATELLKVAGFLPIGLIMTADQLPLVPTVTVELGAISAYKSALPRSLEIASDAQVPLKHATHARFVAFRAKLGGPQHYAILVGDPERQSAPLCRLHSECFTGDIFASLRCDCGEQLNGAIRKMEEAGGGVLLYLSQEGRGIGLVNKLRAYRLQDAGADTVDANTQLGFAPDERNFACAARMLELLNFDKIRLLTNNPIKIAALREHGIDVADRVEHSFEANDHNHFYLATKAKRSGHLLEMKPKLLGNGVGQPTN